MKEEFNNNPFEGWLNLREPNIDVPRIASRSFLELGSSIDHITVLVARRSSNYLPGSTGMEKKEDTFN